MVIEYYSEAGGVLEDKNRMPIDTDDIANIAFATGYPSSPTANRLEVRVQPDDDTVSWKLYARLGSPPNQNQDYLKAQGDRGLLSTAFYASVGTWYLELVGYNWAGSAGPIVSLSKVVGGASASQQPTSGAALSSFSASRGSGSVVLDWTCVAGTSGGTVTITRTDSSTGGTTTITSNASFSGTSGTYTDPQSFSSSGVYKQLTYTITLNGTSSSLSDTYGDYFGGSRPPRFVDTGTQYPV
jgi:hypothetical protein